MIDGFFPPRFENQVPYGRTLRVVLPNDPHFTRSPLRNVYQIFSDLIPVDESERNDDLEPWIREYFRCQLHHLAHRRLIVGQTPLPLSLKYVLGLETDPIDWPGLVRWYGFARPHRELWLTCAFRLAVAGGNGDLDLPNPEELGRDFLADAEPSVETVTSQFDAELSGL